LTLVSGLGVGGTATQIGGVTPEQLAEALRRQAQQDANKAATAAYSPVGAPGVPGARPTAPGVGLPDNFWGFVMLTMGLR